MTKETRIIMGMPVTMEIAGVEPASARGSGVVREAIEKVFEYFLWVDEKFSTFKNTSEITAINEGRLSIENASKEMKEVFLLCDKTKRETGGCFDMINNEGEYDPSGLVKGWAIFNAAKLLESLGFEDFYVEAGGDIQVQGNSGREAGWKTGIRNPFNAKEIVKVVTLKNDEGIATSGNYERGAHIYNPKNRTKELVEIVSLTVIGPNIYEADRFATAAFAMQGQGIYFIEKLPGFEGYAINNQGIATMTSGFEKYTT